MFDLEKRKLIKFINEKVEINYILKIYFEKECKLIK